MKNWRDIVKWYLLTDKNFFIKIIVVTLCGRLSG